MWILDRDGSRFSNAAEAYSELRSRARWAIAKGDELGSDARNQRVRLRDEGGNLLFEGTMQQAAYLQFGHDAPPATALKPDQNSIEVNALAIPDIRYRMNWDWSDLLLVAKNRHLPETRKARPHWWELYLPQIDRALVLDCAIHAIRTKSIFSLRHRVVRLDGSIGCIESKAVPMLHANGNIRGWTGSAFDVTAEHQARQA